MHYCCVFLYIVRVCTLYLLHESITAYRPEVFPGQIVFLLLAVLAPSRTFLGLHYAVDTLRHLILSAINKEEKNRYTVIQFGKNCWKYMYKTT